MTDDNGRWPLPEGWEWTTIGAIRKDSSHSINPAKQPYQYFELYSVPSYPSARPDIVRGSEIGSNKQSIKENSVLLCKINPRINRVWVVGSYSEYPKIASTEWIAFDPVAEIYPKYLRYFMMQDAFRDHLAHNSSGVGGSLMRVRPSTIVDYPFPLAPLPAQHRIVSEIEKQFTRLDAAVAALRRAKANLARYKAAVLKAAVEGRLVAQDPNDEPAAELLARILAERRAQWEAANPKKTYVEPKGVEVAGLPELPVGWVWATVEQLSWDSSYGTSQKCDYEASGPPVLRIPNIVLGYVDLSDMKYAINGDELNSDRSKSLAPGDLLIIRTNGSRKLIGRSALVRHAFISPHYFASYLIRFRLVPLGSIADWVTAIWDSEWIRTQVELGAATSAGQYNISSTVLARLVIPLPPELDQGRIVQDVDRQLTSVRAIEHVIDANLSRADRLRQGVLGKAFRGELVANGEIAEV